MKVERFVTGIISTNCYLAINEETKQTVVIDPAASPSSLMGHLKAEGLKVEAILLTHGHFDHIMAVPELEAEFGAPVYAYEAEEALLKDTQMNLSAPWVGRALSLSAERLLKDGEKFELAGFEIQAIHTPGHTAGGVSYYLAAEQVLFSGDTLFCESYGRTDFPTGSGRDLVSSVVDKLFVLPEEVNVYPGHESQTTIGHEKKYNPLSSYQR